ncbi:hypothetical protein [Aquimarina rhabdastrellae]
MDEKNSSEDIDIGQLFSLIEKGIGKIWSVIKLFLQRIIKLILNSLIFIQTHFLKFLIAGILFGAIGLYLDKQEEPVYQSAMVVSPNFNSAQQLYNNIHFYNELAKEKDSKSLSRALSIEIKEAETIKEISVESYTDETQKIKQFSEFISSLDTISQRNVDYEEYLKNYNDINSKFHRVIFKATDATIAKKCQTSIIESINNNSYFKQQKAVNIDNLKIEDSIIKYQLKEIKSLQEFNKEIKKLQASKEAATTEINLAESKLNPENIEMDLLKRIDELKEDLVELNKEIIDTKNTINVISDFPSRGVRVSVIYEKKTFLLGLLGIFLMFGFLIMKSLNKFLKNYKSSL